MQIHKLTIFLLLTTTQLIKSTEPTDNTYLFYTNHENGFIDKKKYISPNVQQFFIFYLTDNYNKNNISINCNTHHKYYELKNKNTDINTNNDTINIDFTKNTCKIINNADHTTIKNFDIKDYPIIIFEVKEKESDKNSKFIYYIDSNTDNKGVRVLFCGIFDNFDRHGHLNDKPWEINWKEVKIKNVFNKEKWTNIGGLFKSNPIIETFDFGDTELCIKDAISTFNGSSIKKIKNLQNLYTKHFEGLIFSFNNSEIEEINLDKLTLPKYFGYSFQKSKLKKISLNNTNMENTEGLSGFIEDTNVEELDFSTVKNTGKIQYINNLARNCKNLKSIKFGKLITENTKEAENIFENTPNLTTIDLSESKINKELKLFDENSLNTQRNIILPNDEQSAINCLKNLQNIITEAPCQKEPNVTYRNKTITNFCHYDDIDKLIKDPEYHGNNRNKIVRENIKDYNHKVRDIKEQLKKSNNKEKTLKEILKNNYLDFEDIKDLEKITSETSKPEEPTQPEQTTQPDQQDQPNTHKKGKFRKTTNSNSCCKQCCCCCCK